MLSTVVALLLCPPEHIEGLFLKFSKDPFALRQAPHQDGAEHGSQMSQDRSEESEQDEGDRRDNYQGDSELHSAAVSP